MLTVEMRRYLGLLGCMVMLQQRGQKGNSLQATAHVDKGSFLTAPTAYASHDHPQRYIVTYSQRKAWKIKHKCIK